MEDLKYIGGKNINLFKIQDIVDVPSFKAIDSRFYRRFIAESGLESFIDDKIKDFYSSTSMFEQKRITEEIQAAIIKTRLPYYIRVVLSMYLNNMKSKNVAIRSSIIHEDSKRLSFAGIFDSFLDLRSERDVFDAYKKVCASAYSHRALLYYQDNGISSNFHDIAICMMEMVKPIISGVIFSCELSTGNKEIIQIEATDGSCDKLTSGYADFGRYYVFRGSVSSSAKVIKGFTNKMILELSEITKRISSVYDNKIVDVEFCIDENEKIWIVQSRLETYWNFKGPK